MTNTYNDAIFMELELGAVLLDGVIPANNSLASGRLGHVLYLAYTYRLTEAKAQYDQMMQYLQEVLDACMVQNRPAAADTAMSLPGLCFVLQVLKKDGIVPLHLEGPDMVILDEMIFNNARVFLNQHNTDMLAGATGCIHYLVTRIHENGAVGYYLQVLVDLLEKIAVRDKAGIRFNNSYHNKQYPTTEIDLGIPHGQCGLLLVLLKIYEAGIATSQVAGLCNGIIRYICNLQEVTHALPKGSSFYPQGVNELYDFSHPVNLARYQRQAGWCHNDLSVALAFYKAARLLNIPHTAVLADKVTLDYARRGDMAFECRNAGIYTGSAGLSLIYQGLYKERQMEEFAAAQQYWMKFTRKLLQPQFSGQPLTYDAAFLTGMPGALLTLLSGLLPEHTSWQELLLL